MLKDLGIWAGVCDEDGEFFAASTKMRDIMTAGKHPNYRLSVIKGGHHQCYDSIYAYPEFWAWLLAQKRKLGATTAVTNK